LVVKQSAIIGDDPDANDSSTPSDLEDVRDDDDDVGDSLIH